MFLIPDYNNQQVPIQSLSYSLVSYFRHPSYTTAPNATNDLTSPHKYVDGNLWIHLEILNLWDTMLSGDYSHSINILNSLQTLFHTPSHLNCPPVLVLTLLLFLAVAIYLFEFMSSFWLLRWKSCAMQIANN